MSELIDPASQHGPLLGLKMDMVLELVEIWHQRSMKTGVSELVYAAACRGQSICSLLHSPVTVLSCSQNNQGNGAIAHCEDLSYYICRSCTREAGVLGSKRILELSTQAQALGQFTVISDEAAQVHHLASAILQL